MTPGTTQDWLFTVRLKLPGMNASNGTRTFYRGQHWRTYITSDLFFNVQSRLKQLHGMPWVRMGYIPTHFGGLFSLYSIGKKIISDESKASFRHMEGIGPRGSTTEQGSILGNVLTEVSSNASTTA